MMLFQLMFENLQNTFGRIITETQKFKIIDLDCYNVFLKSGEVTDMSYSYTFQFNQMKLLKKLIFIQENVGIVILKSNKYNFYSEFMIEKVEQHSNFMIFKASGWNGI